MLFLSVHIEYIIVAPIAVHVYQTISSHTFIFEVNFVIICLFYFRLILSPLLDLTGLSVLPKMNTMWKVLMCCTQCLLLRLISLCLSFFLPVFWTPNRHGVRCVRKDSRCLLEEKKLSCAVTGANITNRTTIHFTLSLQLLQ